MGKAKLTTNFLLLMIFGLTLLLSGCQTAAGIGVGIGAAAQGVAKDTASAWDGLKGLDGWIRKNMW